MSRFSLYLGTTILSIGVGIGVYFNYWSLERRKQYLEMQKLQLENRKAILNMAQLALMTVGGLFISYRCWRLYMWMFSAVPIPDHKHHHHHK